MDHTALVTATFYNVNRPPTQYTLRGCDWYNRNFCEPKPPETDPDTYQAVVAAIAGDIGVCGPPDLRTTMALAVPLPCQCGAMIDPQPGERRFLCAACARGETEQAVPWGAD